MSIYLKKKSLRTQICTYHKVFTFLMDIISAIGGIKSHRGLKLVLYAKVHQTKIAVTNF